MDRSLDIVALRPTREVISALADTLVETVLREVGLRRGGGHPRLRPKAIRRALRHDHLLEADRRALSRSELNPPPSPRRARRAAELNRARSGRCPWPPPPRRPRPSPPEADARRRARRCAAPPRRAGPAAARTARGSTAAALRPAPAPARPARCASPPGRPGPPRAGQGPY